MKENEFYICDEDNVFDELSALYEDLEPCPYADAPDLDPSLEWYEDDSEMITEDRLPVFETIDESGYGANNLDFRYGDIWLAEVYQEGANWNKAHKRRPFLIIYSSDMKARAFGFQISHSHPASLEHYRVEIPDYASGGLIKPCAFMTNMIRGVDYTKMIRRVGHITEVQKQALLNKLYEIKENKDDLYTDCMHVDKIDITINNVERIRC